MKHIKLYEEFNESVSMDAVYIHQITDCGQNAAQNFIDDNGIDSKKLAAYVKQHRDSKEKYDVRDMISGSQPNPRLMKQFLDEQNGVQLSDLRDSAIKILQKELKWNLPKISIADDSDVKMYSTSKNKLTTSNGLIYSGMAGESLIKDIKNVLDKADINANVFRGLQTGRREEEHDYIIVLN